MEIKKVRTHFWAGSFDLIGLPIGYKIYPITYKGTSYVVMFKVVLNSIAIKQTGDVGVVCNIFEYSEKKKFLQGHKGKHVFTRENISFVKIDEELTVDLRNLSEEEMKIHLPQIMKYLFEEYEVYTAQREEKKKKAAHAEQWDGVID